MFKNKKTVDEDVSFFEIMWVSGFGLNRVQIFKSEKKKFPRNIPEKVNISKLFFFIFL